MKLSVVTVALNNANYIEDCIKSVISQDYENTEHIIIDGGSTDGTVQIIEKYSDKISKWVSEPDEGLFDAMNKGIDLATGDIVGILNADDIYYNTGCLSLIAENFHATNTDSVYADIVYVERNNLDKIVRYCNLNHFDPSKFAFGWTPPHPTFYVKRELYETFGKFRTDYVMAADYEIMLRFLAIHGISYRYIPKVLVKMRMGGISTRSFKDIWVLNKEVIRACEENGIATNMLKVFSKYPIKMIQLVRRP